MRILLSTHSRDALSKLDLDEKDDVGLTDAIGRTQNTSIQIKKETTRQQLNCHLSRSSFL